MDSWNREAIANPVKRTRASAVKNEEALKVRCTVSSNFPTKYTVLAINGKESKDERLVVIGVVIVGKTPTSRFGTDQVCRQQHIRLCQSGPTWTGTEVAR